MVPCLDCGTPCRGPRCATHTRQQRAKYSRAAGHPQLRQAWAPTVATGTVICARCAYPIQPDEQWHLDHLASGESKPSHAHCNVVAGGAGIA